MFCVPRYCKSWGSEFFFARSPRKNPPSKPRCCQIKSCTISKRSTCHALPPKCDMKHCLTNLKHRHIRANGAFCVFQNTMYAIMHFWLGIRLGPHWIAHDALPNPHPTPAIGGRWILGASPL